MTGFPGPVNVGEKGFVGPLEKGGSPEPKGRKVTDVTTRDDLSSGHARATRSNGITTCDESVSSTRSRHTLPTCSSRCECVHHDSVQLCSFSVDFLALVVIYVALAIFHCENSSISK